jgi:cytochrome c-type biogenesis protein CcmH
MSLLIATALAAGALLAMVLLFRLQRAAGFAIGSALILGLAGFALQSDPGKPGVPAGVRTEGAAGDGLALIKARRLFFNANLQPNNGLIFADAFTRRGQYADAATVLRALVRQHPRDAEAWVALGTALAAQGQGTLAPPAVMAYRKAAEAAPGNLAPGFFMGVAELQAGRLVEGYKLWAAALRQGRSDADGRAELEQRLQQLDTLMRQIAAQ